MATRDKSRWVRMVGGRYGRLFVTGTSPSVGKGLRLACRCDCGKDVVVDAYKVASGNTSSCGCYRADAGAARNWKHGRKRSAEYAAWCHIKARCYNPKVVAYARYGGRGIRMSEAWLHDFDTFLRDVGLRPSPLHSIDRIDVNGHYEPGNVRWADRKTQGRNTTANRHIEHRGEVKTIAEWAESLGLKYGTLFSRLNRGWPVDVAFALPLQDQTDNLPGRRR